MNLCYLAAIWLGVAVLASVIRVRLAAPVALVGIMVGALAGNIPGMKETPPGPMWPRSLRASARSCPPFSLRLRSTRSPCASTGGHSRRLTAARLLLC